jgi:hypothetical protein
MKSDTYKKAARDKKQTDVQCRSQILGQMAARMAAWLSFIDRRIWTLGHRLFSGQAVAGKETEADLKDVLGRFDAGEKVCRIA